MQSHFLFKVMDRSSLGIVAEYHDRETVEQLTRSDVSKSDVLITRVTMSRHNSGRAILGKVRWKNLRRRARLTRTEGHFQNTYCGDFGIAVKSRSNEMKGRFHFSSRWKCAGMHVTKVRDRTEREINRAARAVPCIIFFLVCPGCSAFGQKEDYVSDS